MTEFTGTLTYEPFRDLSAENAETLIELGKFVFLWGNLDSLFATSMYQLNALQPPERKRQNLPTAFSARLRFWRDSFESLPQLSETKAYALEWASRVEAAHEDRSLLFHGNWTGFNSAGPVHIIRHKHGKRQRKEMILTSTMLREKLNGLNYLFMALFSLKLSALGGRIPRQGRIVE